MAKLAESRDSDTGDHLDRIRSFVTILAKGLQQTLPDFSNEYIDTLGVASSLHDIGKVGIPDSVLLKPSRLAREERAVMETHAELGAECIAAIIERLGEDDFLTVAHEIALSHHEKYDGTGYPAKLQGNEIPISARIVALADVYDALVSPSVYKRPMTHKQAREIILEGAGQHFDPTIFLAFVDRESEFIEITERLHASIEETAQSHEDLPTTPSGDAVADFQPAMMLSTRP
ncbi:MAG: HD domain-containing phosphohydrolase [Planctomycetota bacterium]|nr:HD domain-containing phosphohydrolase [Planctomycetota bacterium]